MGIATRVQKLGDEMKKLIALPILWSLAILVGGFTFYQPTKQVVEFVEVSDIEADEIVEAVEEPALEQQESEPEPIQEPVYEYTQPTTNAPTGSFKSDGVRYDDNYKYTYYSSNVTYHYQTSEWTADSEGIYRDSDGYVVVASCDLPKGSVVESTPFGAAKVYDYCGIPGTLDVYTNF